MDLGFHSGQGGIDHDEKTGMFTVYYRDRAIGTFVKQKDAEAALDRAKKRTQRNIILFFCIILPVIIGAIAKYWGPVIWYLQTGYWYNP